MMREQEVMTDNFLPSKKEIQKSFKDFALELIDKGEVNLFEVFAQSIRYKEAFSIIESEIKNKLPQEKFESFGVKGVYKNGGSVFNYNEDDVIQKLNKLIETRKKLLETAYYSDTPIYDEDGVEVPKISKKQRKSSLAITF